MSATIYVTKEAWATSQAIKDLDYYDRVTLSDHQETDPTGKEGYYLKTTLNLAPLPDDAQVVLRISPGDANYAAMVSFDASLRGIIFERSQNLPDRYAEIVRHWAGEPLNSNVGNAAFYQNPMQAYDIDLSAVHDNYDLFSQRQSSTAVDALISESVVVSIVGLDGATADAPADAFVEIALPIDESMVRLDNGEFLTEKAYDLRDTGRVERIFLRVSSIRNSPDPSRIFVDILRYEELDYGFYY